MSIKSIGHQPSFRGAIIVPNNLIANSRKLIPELVEAKKTHSHRNYEIFLFKPEQNGVEEKIMNRLKQLDQDVLRYKNGNKKVPLKRAIELAEIVY